MLLYIKKAWLQKFRGSEDEMAMHNFMAMKLFLTAKGLEKVDHIVTVVYAYINMLKRKGPRK